jgi:hypothetical protein
MFIPKDHPTDGAFANLVAQWPQQPPKWAQIEGVQVAKSSYGESWGAYSTRPEGGLCIAWTRLKSRWHVTLTHVESGLALVSKRADGELVSGKRSEVDGLRAIWEDLRGAADWTLTGEELCAISDMPALVRAAVERHLPGPESWRLRDEDGHAISEHPTREDALRAADALCGLRAPALLAIEGWRVRPGRPWSERWEKGLASMTIPAEWTLEAWEAAGGGGQGRLAYLEVRTAHGAYGERAVCTPEGSEVSGELPVWGRSEEDRRVILEVVRERVWRPARAWMAPVLRRAAHAGLVTIERCPEVGWARPERQPPGYVRPTLRGLLELGRLARETPRAGVTGALLGKLLDAREDLRLQDQRRGDSGRIEALAFGEDEITHGRVEAWLGILECVEGLRVEGRSVVLVGAPDWRRLPEGEIFFLSGGVVGIEVKGPVSWSWYVSRLFPVLAWAPEVAIGQPRGKLGRALKGHYRGSGWGDSSGARDWATTYAEELAASPEAQMSAWEILRGC